MMKIVLFIFLLIACDLSYLANALQTPSVAVRFEVDGNVVLAPKFKILINVDGRQIEPKYTAHGFIVPKEVKKGRVINVLFKSGKYKLSFPLIKNHNFDTEWVIGVDVPPFNAPDETPLIKDGKKLVMVYYIEFHPHKFEGSRWVKTVNK